MSAHRCLQLAAAALAIECSFIACTVCRVLLAYYNAMRLCDGKLFSSSSIVGCMLLYYQGHTSASRLENSANNFEVGAVVLHAYARARVFGGVV